MQYKEMATTRQKMAWNSWTLIAIILFLQLLCAVSSDDTYTSQEKAALEKFRQTMKNHLYRDYMHTDKYLIRWLRANKLNIEQAKEMLEKTLRWRKENQIDTIVDEDYNKFRKEFPVFREGVDKDGRPVSIYLFGEYDFRKVVIAGETERFRRYVVRLFEMTEQYVNNMNNVSDIITIYDLQGFNRRQHLCILCLAVGVHYTRTYETYYPELSYKVYFVNVPTVFEDALRVIQPLFSERTKKKVRFLGFDKREWGNELFNQIPKDQLIQRFGGTRKMNRTNSI